MSCLPLLLVTFLLQALFIIFGLWSLSLISENLSHYYKSESEMVHHCIFQVVFQMCLFENHSEHPLTEQELIHTSSKKP